MNFRCSRSSLDNYILLYYRRLAIKVYLHKRTFDIELSVLFLCLQIGGVKMEESVTLKLGRYDALRDKARRVDVLEKENAELRERLDNTMTIRSRTGGVTVGPKGIKSFVDSDKYINAVDGAELRNDTNKVTLDATEVYQVIRQAFDKVKEELELDGDKYAKSIKGSKLRCRKHYAKGGVTTKEEATELKRSKMKQRRIIK